MMVFDEYKQVYVGTTQHLRRRIQEHWNSKMPIDRLIFGDFFASRLSIDSFRALDTTRLYARIVSEDDAFGEEEAEELSDDRYRLNRTGLGALMGGFPEAVETIIGEKAPVVCPPAPEYHSKAGQLVLLKKAERGNVIKIAMESVLIP